MATPRHAWQHPRHALQRPRHAMQSPRRALQRPRRPRHAFLQGLRSPTSKKNPPTCCLISCEAKGVVYHQVSMMRHQSRAPHQAWGLEAMLKVRAVEPRPFLVPGWGHD